MAYQKLQVSEGLAVIPSNTVAIPDPSSKIFEGTGDFSVSNTLTDVGTNFLTQGIQIMSPGPAIIYNITAGVAYYVKSIDSDTQLTLSISIVGGNADKYTIYNAATSGCILFVGGAGDIQLVMAGKNGNEAWNSSSSIAFKGIAAGSFLPTQVIGVGGSGTTATDIIALW
tara:strand:+ start:264 stop:773 length:510 start_codon:yes stop_codon:yes gene_type:complete